MFRWIQRAIQKRRTQRQQNRQARQQARAQRKEEKHQRKMERKQMRLDARLARAQARQQTRLAKQQMQSEEAIANNAIQYADNENAYNAGYEPMDDGGFTSSAQQSTGSKIMGGIGGVLGTIFGKKNEEPAYETEQGNSPTIVMPSGSGYTGGGDNNSPQSPLQPRQEPENNFMGIPTNMLLIGGVVAAGLFMMNKNKKPYGTRRKR